MMPEESHTSINGLHLAKNIVEHLKLNIGKRELAEGDNFNDYGLWHARITGLFAEAGVKENLMIEVSREFRRKWHSDFLNRYIALYRHRKLGMWTDKPSSTEIDVVYLNPVNCSVIAMCEYENEGEFNMIADNIVKFHALASSTEENCKPALCIVSFFWGDEPEWVCGDIILNDLRKLIEMATGEEKILFKDKVFEFPPMESWWLIIPFYGRKENIYWRYLIVDPQGKPEEEKEFSLKINI